MAHKQLVREWMTPDPVVVAPDISVAEAHRIMTMRKIRRLPVLEKGTLVGIVTLGDLRGAEPSEATSLSVWEVHTLLDRLTLRRIMSRPVHTIAAGARIGEAAKRMLENKIGGLPVMEGDRLVGIITESDIFRLVVQHWVQEEAGEPVR